MAESREITGIWWLPPNVDEKWVGTLTLSQQKSPKLKLIVPKPFYGFGQTLIPNLILGHDANGLPISLLHPGVPNSQGGIALSKLHFQAGYALIGIQVNDAESFVVNSLQLRLQHLYEWMEMNGYPPEEQRQEAQFIQITYRCPEDQKFNVNHDLKIELGASYSFDTSIHSRSIEEDAVVSLESSQGFGIAQCKRFLNALRNLLHFAVLQPIYPIKMTALKTGHGRTANDGFIPTEIELCNSIVRDRVESELSAERWVFRFADLKPRFAEFFKNWLEFLDVYDEAIRCYSATVYHNQPSEIENICLTQALETYHATKNPTRNGIRFRQRILELATKYQSSLLGLVDNPETFSDIVRDNRNYHTHHDPEILNHGRVLKGAELIRLNEKLSLIFQMCVLTEIGISSDRFVRLRRQLAIHIIDYV